MKIISKLHLAFYICILVYICLIPNTITDAKIFKIILTLSTLSIFILLGTFYTVISFNKKYIGLKKNIYIIIIFLFSSILVFIVLGHTINKQTDNIIWLIVIMVILFLLTTTFQYKIKTKLEKHQFDLIRETKMFLKMGNALEETPIMLAISRMEYLFYGFSISVFIVDNIYFFSGIVVVILLLSIKPLLVIKSEFSKSKLISIKESYFSIISYIFCYLVSVVWFVFFPNLSVLLVGSVSLLALKIYIHRIANKVYDEQNSF